MLRQFADASLRSIIREAIALDLDEGKGLADDIVKWCRRHPDLSVDRTAKGHIKVNVKGHGDMSGKSSMVITAGTASDYRSDLNFRSMMRRKLREMGWTDSEIGDMPG